MTFALQAKAQPKEPHQSVLIIIFIPSETTHSASDGSLVSNSATLLYMTFKSLFLALIRLQLALVSESLHENLNKADFPSGLPKTVFNYHHSSVQTPM